MNSNLFFINTAKHVAMSSRTHAIDLEHLSSYTGGDAALMAEIFGLFREQVALWGQLLSPDAPSGSFRDAAHSLKGSAKGIGAWALADVCSIAEQLSGAEASPAKRAVVVHDIRTELDKVLQDIAALVHAGHMRGLRG